ncbi:immunity 22 family protein [Pseudoalteromonas sp. KG3]|uniref:Immunity 22 family protein n=1 Tax=Pseudoalteromonas prydzensis TaxID=182141 RepID=A0ABR9FRT0_9GAMM|nr:MULTISPECIES: immunity 22 family protein [Pseudoalteromonas]MBE0459536.1 immunity 22 family protein [Pseudoalteromonas prydzensis]WKD25009.1 immunity 22 family protein [Pseudoalteromonas sp. KG3]
MSKTEVSHFYLGRVSDHWKYNAFLEEHYGEDDDEPLSAFCGSQDELFIDHDFMEMGARDDGATVAEFFSPYSYSEHWSEAVAKVASECNLTDANVLLFVSKSEIENPKSISGDGFELIYIGEFEYPI